MFGTGLYRIRRERDEGISRNMHTIHFHSVCRSDSGQEKVRAQTQRLAENAIYQGNRGQCALRERPERVREGLVEGIPQQADVLRLGGEEIAGQGQRDRAVLRRCGGCQRSAERRTRACSAPASMPIMPSRSMSATGTPPSICIRSRCQWSPRIPRSAHTRYDSRSLDVGGSLDSTRLRVISAVIVTS